MNNVSKIPMFDKLNRFIRKYYANQLIKGSIYAFTILSLYFILISVLEHYSQFSILMRTILFWSFIIIVIIILVKFIFLPLLHLFRIGKIISYKQAAIIIGQYFKEIDDKILNVLQLQDMSDDESELINASIEQKIVKIRPFQFTNAINYNDNKKYIKWGLIPVILFFVFLLSGKKHIITESSARIIKHNTFFEPKAPFDFVVDESKLKVISQEDCQLHIELNGNEIPDKAFIIMKNNKYLLKKIEINRFTYSVKNVISNTSFKLYADGFYSKDYTIIAMPKPSIINFEVFISPPNYTKLKKEKLINVGDLNIPEGTYVNWNFDVRNTDRLFLDINGEKHPSKLLNKERMSFNYRFRTAKFYQIITENDYFISDSIRYQVNIIPDSYPSIFVEQQIDSITNNIFFNGEVKDDYNLTKLEFCYNLKKKDSVSIIKIDIPIESISQQQFFHHADFSLLNFELSDHLSYYFQVWDNDAVNGHKSTKSKQFSLFIPDTKHLNNILAKEENQIKHQLKQSIRLAKEIKKDIKLINKNFLEKKEFGWEEKKKVESLIKKQEILQKNLSALKRKNSGHLKKQEQYKKLPLEFLEKQKQLEKLFDEILDEETKKLLEEMQKMMEEMNKEELKKMLDKMNDVNLEKELDRNLELFKQLEFEQKLFNALDKLKDILEKQKKLKESTDNKNSDKNYLAKEQEELKNKFHELEKDLDELEKKNQGLENKNKIPNTNEDQKEIEKNMTESKNALQNNQKKKSSKSQQKAINKMKSLENKLQALQSSCSGSQEDMETLRQILENLIHLSFDQESLMKRVEITPKNSPSYIKLVMTQKKLVDDALIVEDSLFALSKRVVELQHTVNKEISSIKNNMENATKNLEDRIVNKAMSQQQFTMTSANNLALLLSEMLKQMQQQCSSSSSKPSNCNKPGAGKPSLSKLKQMQKKLNEQMKGAMGKKGGKKGKKLNDGQCENLSKLARQQENIRRQLQELRNELEKSGKKGNIDKMIEKMEENEIDIVNNKISRETIKRQEEILSRLLKAEKAERERDEEPKRESSEWEYEFTNTNKSYISYKKLKEKQFELLKTNPLKLTPFYKSKVSNYFNQLVKEQK